MTGICSKHQGGRELCEAEDEKDFEELWGDLIKPYTKLDPDQWIWKAYAKSAWLASRRTLREKLEWIESKKRELEEDPKEIFKKKYIGEFREQKEGKDG